MLVGTGESRRKSSVQVDSKNSEMSCVVVTANVRLAHKTQQRLEIATRAIAVDDAGSVARFGAPAKAFV